MSSGKMPEYTMLTPLPLTPDVMPHDFEHQLVSLGLTTLPSELTIPHHYSYLNVVPAGPIFGPPGVILENGNNINNDNNNSPDPSRTSPEVDDDDDDDYRPPSAGNSGSIEGDSDQGGEGGGKIAKDPFAPQCKIPLPTPFSPYEYWLEPSFIRRRNERERQRVRNVNDGFERLKGHLPINSKDKDKRLSKVEILRMAIRYIRNLQDMLKNDGLDDSKENMACIQSDSD